MLGLISTDYVDVLDSIDLAKLDHDLKDVLWSEWIAVVGRYSRDEPDGQAVDAEACFPLCQMELEFSGDFYPDVESVLRYYFGYGGDCASMGVVLRHLERLVEGEEDCLFREYGADGRPVVYRSDDGGTAEVCIFSVGRQSKEDGDVLSRRSLVETFIALCRYRGLLSMNLVRDIDRFSTVESRESLVNRVRSRYPRRS
jgi:hypothetical protein